MKYLITKKRKREIRKRFFTYLPDNPEAEHDREMEDISERSRHKFRSQLEIRRKEWWGCMCGDCVALRITKLFKQMKAEEANPSPNWFIKILMEE